MIEPWLNLAFQVVGRRYLRTVRTTLFSALLLTVVSSVSAADAWKFHCEADKGDMTASLRRQPASLDSYILELPRYSPDPPERDAVIQSTTVRVVGTFRKHRIVEAHIQFKETYYTDFYILLCETVPGRYLPIYAQQYGPGRTPGLTSFSATDDRCSITVMVRYSGTGASKTSDNITLTEDARNGIKLRWKRKA
jgi:hypothetical protein